MSQIIQLLNSQSGPLITALIQHLEMSLAALAVAMLIAIPLAIWVKNHHKFAEFLLQIASILQTIPSLALLGLLIPIVGIGTLPAIIALVIYALLPIFQNTYIGLVQIDPSIQEAANALGMTERQKIMKVELPIALPTIISGIRTSLVLIIGTATLAALIGAGGLGTFILLGIDRNNTALILMGAISSALLAIILPFGIKLIQKMNIKGMIISIIAFLIVIGTMLGTEIVQSSQNQVVIAGKLGGEPDIIINMYKDLIEDKQPSQKVVLKNNFGKTNFVFAALKNDQIDIYPEFTGTILQGITNTPITASGSNGIYQEAKAVIKKRDDLEYLKPMKYNNSYGLAVTSDFARKYHVKTISDLSKIRNKINAGMSLEFIDRKDGLKSIEKKYHLKFKVHSMDPQLRYGAIAHNKINLVDCYEVDSAIIKYHLVVLKDDKQAFPPYQAAPLMKESFAKKNPQVVYSLNKLKNHISNKEMQKMNYAVDTQKQSPAQVAREYLVKNKLIRR